MSDTLMVLGTSRPNGNTRLLVDAVMRAVPRTFFDISSSMVAPFDYEHRYSYDGFEAIAEAMTRHERIVLATPVYWYAMSAQLKAFIDRFTDLIQIRKPIGRALAGRTLTVLATGTDPELPAGFDQPFALTAKYFSMTWLGAFYSLFEQDLVLPSHLGRDASAWVCRRASYRMNRERS